MTRVNVICGGTSAERAVSLRSGAAVAAALQAAGHAVNTLDLADSSIQEIITCEVVFPVLHGAGGEDGELQVELEREGATFVGSGSAASALCFDKWRYRQVITDAGLPMTDAALVRLDTYRQHNLASQPYVLKPLNGGSSIDTYIIRDINDAPTDKMADTFSRYPTMLIERLIEGIELTVGVLGDDSLPVIEIIPPADGEFDYENKYNGASQELCPPEHVSGDIQVRAQQLALQAHTTAGCRDFSRTDIFYEVTSDKLFLLETNTIPGMTDQSLFPKMARTAGLKMTELCSLLVSMAANR